MKKFLALLLAIVIGLFSTTVGHTDTVTVDTPDDTKYTEWAISYSKRCKAYRGKLRVNNTFARDFKRIARRVALAPLALLIGTASAEGAKPEGKLIVSYVGTVNGKRQLFQMITTDRKAAREAYDSVAKKGYPSAIHYTEGKGTILCEAANKWHIGDEKKVAQAPLTAISDAFCEKARAILNPNYGPQDNRMWVFDKVRKPVPTTEEIFRFIGAKTILVECHIPEWEMASHGDLSAEPIAELKQAVWDKVCVEGLKVNGIDFMFLGHGTNAGKQGHCIFVDKEHLVQAFEILHKVDSEWITTPAKGIAYLTGLQNVRPKVWVDLPIQPEDFTFFREIKESVSTDRADMINGNVFKKAASEGGRTNKFSKADGQCLVHVSAKKRTMWIDHFAAAGMSYEEAEKHVDKQIAMLKNSFSARTRNAALKFSALWYDFHKEWKLETGTSICNGRDIDDLVFIGDDSVRKTSVGGEGAAFHSEQEWCDAVRFDKTTGHKFQLGLLIMEDHLKHKDLPYQFMQLLYGASDTLIERLAKNMVAKVNGLHKLEGLGKYLTKDLKALLKVAPEAGCHPVIRERLENAFYNRIDNIMSGKYLDAGLYGMMHGDPCYQLQSYMVQDGHDVEVVGMLDAGQIYILGDTTDKNDGQDVIAYRSPIATLGALKRMKTALPKAEYAEYLDGAGPCLIFNVKDDAVTQLAGDYDGDHGGVCKDFHINCAVAEAQAKYGTWLPISDPGKPQKGKFTIEACHEYAKGLTLISPLGQTMIEQHKILNGIQYVWKDRKIVGRKAFVPNADAVLSEGDHALNQVDASKHGNTTGKKHAACERQGKSGMLAKSKVYRDTIKRSKGPVNRATLRNIEPEPEELCVGVLNRIFRYVYMNANLKFGLDDVPELDQEWSDELADRVLEKIMFNPEDKSFRGMSGLFRKGKYDKDLGFCPDEGQFQSLSRRGYKTWKMICGSGDGDRRMSKKEFAAAIRKQGLDEIERLATMLGCTLEDAYDVVAWQMFKYSHIKYAKKKEDDKIDEILLADLWNTFFDVFGQTVVYVAGIKGVTVEDEVEDLDDLDVLNDCDDDDDCE